MSKIVTGVFYVNSSPYNGATAKLWSSAAFSSDPAYDTALPDSGYLLDTVVTGVTFGSPGAYKFDTTEDAKFFVSIEYSGHIYWRTVDNNGDSDGWVAAGETWTYYSSDSPSFVFTIPGDKTDKYSAGMKIKLTQTTTKYFIVTKVVYSAPNTHVTVFGRFNYTLINAAITNNYYSNQKVPFGFPHDGWFVEVESNLNQIQSNPVQNTWYNQLSIIIPIGLWRVYWTAELEGQRGVANYCSVYGTLSTSNNGETQKRLTGSGAVIGTYVGEHIFCETKLELTNKATYYLNIKTSDATMSSISLLGVSVTPTVIRAECAYL